MLLESKESIGDAIYTFAGTEEEVEETEAVINNLKSIGNQGNDDILEHHFLSREEITQRGYDPNHVKKAAVFPKDGNFPPYLDQELERVIQDRGGAVQDNMQLLRILVKCQGEDDVRVTKIIWKDTKTGDLHTTPVNSLYLSLGPSMKSLTVDSNDFAMSGNFQNILHNRDAIKCYC